MNKKTLVLGASLNPVRYSNKAIERLVAAQIKTVAIGLRSGSVAGVIIETEKIAFTAVDTVTLYLNPERQKEYYSYIISLKPRRVIFNPGTENKEFYALLSANKIDYEIACTLVLLATNQF
ncbi:CoA-binding protein [Tenacibaculum piscium]|uniref:CoA-binding protein n=1 Tax=Tenacibaculum piscium TaxID=1458515 RepID=UPI001F3E3F7B|nr:CoA-binding protein [Tenacibaculum piscium]